MRVIGAIFETNTMPRRLFQGGVHAEIGTGGGVKSIEVWLTCKNKCAHLLLLVLLVFHTLLVLGSRGELEVVGNYITSDYPSWWGSRVMEKHQEAMMLETMPA
jgi:hypothetical protein